MKFENVVVGCYSIETIIVHNTDKIKLIMPSKAKKKAGSSPAGGKELLCYWKIIRYSWSVDGVVLPINIESIETSSEVTAEEP